MYDTMCTVKVRINFFKLSNETILPQVQKAKSFKKLGGEKNAGDTLKQVL